MLAGNVQFNPYIKRNQSGHGPNVFDPLKETMVKHRQIKKNSNFSRATLNETFTVKYNGILSRTP